MIDLDRLRERLPAPRTLAIAAAAIVVVGLLAAGGWYWYDAARREAGTIYAAAMAQAQAARAPQAPPAARAAAIGALEGVLQRHPSSAMAAEAAYELAGLRFADGQHAAARSAYEVARARAAGPTVKTLARLGIGYTWEAERNWAKATEVFQAAAAELKPAEAFWEQALLDLGRVQELGGRKDDAIETYRRLLKEAARSPRADEVRLRLASLGAAP
jgi:tetratricopeptide (TPR) repeat protein